MNFLQRLISVLLIVASHIIDQSLTTGKSNVWFFVVISFLLLELLAHQNLDVVIIFFLFLSCVSALRILMIHDAGLASILVALYTLHWVAYLTFFAN